VIKRESTVNIFIKTTIEKKSNIYLLGDSKPGFLE